MDLSYFDNSVINLEVLAEEAAEVIQAKSKIIRFGFNEQNCKRLETEIGDFLALVDILLDEKLISSNGLQEAKKAKLEKLVNYY